MESRWGNAATFIPSPPTILYQGGKTDRSGGSTYNTAPNSDDTTLLSLTDPFDAVSPPTHTVDTTTAPPYAFHTLSTLNGTGSTWDLLAFGGDAGSSEPTQTQANSVWRGRVDAEAGTVEWTHEPTSWGNQPLRRLYHSAAGPDEDGKVYITGGLKGDGSGATFADVYAYDSGTAQFETLSSLPEGMYGHSSVLLPNGTLVLVGGVSTSPVTGNPVTTPMTRVYSLDTASQASAWQEVGVSGEEPAGRRGTAMVLSGDGSKAFLYGGGDAALNEAYADGWELDLTTSTWRPIDNGDGGPGARFGHTAVNVGRDQIVLFGGYAQGGPVAPNMFIWNAGSGQWAPSYSPPAPVVPPPSQPPESTGTATSSPSASASGSSSSPSMPQTNAAGETVTPYKTGTGAGNYPTVSTTSSSPDSSSATPGLSTPAKIALIVGVVAIAGAVVAGLLYRYRRKKRQAARMGAAAWLGRRPGGDRPYGPREKGGEGLMDEHTGRGEMGEKSPMVGLGMGAIGATLASITSKLGRGRQEEDPYTVLHDRGASYGGPLRKSTRRVGEGIRLIGPRPSPSASRYAPIRLGAGASRIRSPLDSVKETRIDMLHDEDSREFQRDDWVMSGRAEQGRWTSARSILGHEHEESDPFSDGDDDDDSLAPPIQGGPVPTPHASRSELDPFDDHHHRRSSTYLASFDDLLDPPAASHSDEGSFPRSQRSGITGSMSDMEEGVVQQAHLASPTSPSVLSPAESEYRPIKRTDSFFKRMTGGGLSSLLSRQPSQRGTVRVLDIHDPTPSPALWPIESRDDIASPTESAEPSYPPTAFKGGHAPGSGHAKGPSLSSLQSAKSMRDMVIVQRERTESSEAEGVIEAGTPDLELREGEAIALDQRGIPGSGSHVTVYAHARHGETVVSEAVSPPASPPNVGGETPGPIVFNGADFAPTPMVAAGPTTPPSNAPFVAAGSSTAHKASTPPKIPDNPPKASPRPIGDILHDRSTPGRIPEPPSGSPVPSPLVSHRRAVKDVVNSINKRGGGLPLAFASPASNYSPSTTAPPSPLSVRSGVEAKRRPVTMYEAVKRERLLVANPDKRKEFNRTNSS